jgi:hypothetical protein
MSMSLYVWSAPVITDADEAAVFVGRFVAVVAVVSLLATAHARFGAGA